MSIPNREEVASSAMGDGNESRFVSFHSHAWSGAKWLTAARHPNVFLLFFVAVICMCVFVCFVQTLQWLTPWRHPTASIQQSFTIADTCVIASSSTTAKNHYDLLCFIWLRLPSCLFSPLSLIFGLSEQKMTKLMINITGNNFDRLGALSVYS